MSHEQTPVSREAEWQYNNHKIDVEAARQLGGLAFVGDSPEPGAELSQRSHWLLEQADGDVAKAAAEGKSSIGKNEKINGRMVDEKLDQYIDQAREDMERERPTITNPPRSLQQMEAARAIDPTTGETVDVLPVEHYAGHRSRYHSGNVSRFSPNR